MPERQHDIELSGCAPEPLMSYLKALGILRLVSEQADPAARGWWRNDTFWLRAPMLFDGAGTGEARRDALVNFFLEEYRPTPIVVPWTGSDFFEVKSDGDSGPFPKTPTATKVIEAFLASATNRLQHYRAVIRATLAAMAECGIDKKEDIDTQKGKSAQRRKAAFYSHLRQSLDDHVLAWIDAAGICADDLRFSALLGSGGGSDGNAHFSDNFMQNLWDVLPDFDAQRKAKKNQRDSSTTETSSAYLWNALFESARVPLFHKRTSSLFDSGAVGGPNATQGMERDSLSNPWHVILALEGSIAFAGAATKRLNASGPSDTAFPFQVSATATDRDGLANKERSGSEVWLPLWDRPALSEEVLTMLREGRAQCGARPARSGLDMARAAATLGVDRGIDVFSRYAIVKGRVGGDNYNTAACLGRFEVHERREADLVREIDPWLDRFRRAAGDDKAPPRFGRALRAIDSAIFDFCRYGGKPLFQKILIALGHAERELALTPGKVGQSKWPPSPLAGLSRDWIDAAGDDYDEFAIARALAGVYDAHGRVGSLRTNLEPVRTWYAIQEERQMATWADKGRAVVWNAAALPTNLAAVLARRTMDGEREGCENLPLASRATAPLSAIAAFIAAETDDRLIEDLLRGLMLVESCPHHPRESDDAPGVPAGYALLKFLFLPDPLVIERRDDGRAAGARMVHADEPKERGVRIRREPRIPHLLRAGRLGEACEIAMCRLRASGLAPMPRARAGRSRDDDWKELDRMGSAGVDPARLAAALLIPISDAAVSRLVTHITRPEDIETEPEPAATLTAGD